jgi:hypothetical protein
VNLERGLAVFEKNNPYDVLMKTVEIVAEHGDLFAMLGDEINRQDSLMAELVNQHHLLLQNIRVMNESIKLINVRLAQLEGKINEV